VPNPSVTIATTEATIALLTTASRNAGESTISRYQRIEKPANGKVRLPPALNENSTTTPSGTNRNNSAANVIALANGA
jgi:hypothetical protein